MVCERRPVGILAVVALAAACAARQPPTPSDEDRLVYAGRSPLRCSSWRLDQADGALEARGVSGCDVRPAFYLERSGWTEVDVPTYRDGDVRRRTFSARGERTLRRRLTLADPSGLGLWSVDVDEDALGWSGDGRCVAPRPGDPRDAFDGSAWRFLVVHVRTRGPYGGLTTWKGTGDDDALRVLRLEGARGRRVEKVGVTASETVDGLWVLSWCADAAEAPFTAKVAVTDTSMGGGVTALLPAEVAADTYTVLELVVDPAPPL